MQKQNQSKTFTTMLKFLRANSKTLKPIPKLFSSVITYSMTITLFNRINGLTVFNLDNFKIRELENR